MIRKQDFPHKLRTKAFSDDYSAVSSDLECKERTEGDSAVIQHRRQRRRLRRGWLLWETFNASAAVTLYQPKARWRWRRSSSTADTWARRLLHPRYFTRWCRKRVRVAVTTFACPTIVRKMHAEPSTPSATTEQRKYLCHTNYINNVANHR